MEYNNIKFNNEKDKLYFDTLIEKYNLGVDFDHLIKLKDYHKLDNVSESLLYYIWYKLGEGLSNISDEHEHALSWVKIKFYFMNSPESVNVGKPVGFFYFDDIEDYQVWSKFKNSIVSKLDTVYKVYAEIFELLLINNKETVSS
jgi:hypothetical protein